MQFIRQSKFKHVFGKLSKQDSYENLRFTKSNSESTYLAINSKYLAFISEAGGGGVFTVIPLSKTGKQEMNYGIVTGHTAPVTDIAWCPFDDSLIASSSEDCNIIIWRITDDLASSISFEVIATLSLHQRKIQHIKWHPLVQDVLISAGSDNTLIVWNLITLQPIHTFELTKQVTSMSISFTGKKLLVGCKDSQVKLIDLIKGTIIQENESHQSSKAVQVAYVDENYFITTGFSKRCDRQLAVWNIEEMSEPVAKIDIDVSNGSLYPFFDCDTKLIFLLAKGDVGIKYFEYDGSDHSIHFLNRYDSIEPQTGFSFLPKYALNVNKNEIMRLYKMTNKKNCEVINFIVPRKSEQFQEDIYPDTIGQVPAATIDDWLQGKELEITRYSMKQNYGADVVRRNFSMKSAVNCSGIGSRASVYGGTFENNTEKGSEIKEHIKTIEELKMKLETANEKIQDLTQRLELVESKLVTDSAPTLTTT